jgi:hypothetical protein
MSEEIHTPADVRIPSQVRTDIRTSEIPPRLAEDGEHVREYSPVLHDKPPREFPARSGNEVFGTNVLPEPISVSTANARWYLALLYGTDIADKMIGQAFITGGVISGERFKVTDTQARTQGKMSVTTDKSRPGMLVLVPHILRQSGGAKK